MENTSNKKLSFIEQTSFNFKLNTEKLLIFEFSILLILGSCAAFLSDSTLASSVSLLLSKFLMYIFLATNIFILALDSKNGNIFVLKNIFLCASPIIYWCLYFFNKYDQTIPINITSIILLCFFLMTNSGIKRRIFNVYIKFLLFISLYGILIYICCAISLNLPHRVCEYYSQSIGGQYYDYLFGYIYVNGTSKRLCGLFNEPGFFGTILALVMCAKYDELPFLYKAVFFLAGCFTFSLAFFLLIFVYIILRNIKKPQWILFLLLLGLFYYFILPQIHIGIDSIDKLINRLQFTNGSLNGDNRSNDLINELFKRVLHGENILFGFGNGYLRLITDGVLTYKSYIIEYGLLGSLLIYLPLLIAAIRHGGIKKKAFIFVFFLSVYQRPNIFNIVYFVILFGGTIQGFYRVKRR